MILAGAFELLVIAVVFFPIASVSGLIEGRRSGYRGIPIGRACLHGFRRAFFTTTLSAVVIINAASLVLLMGPGGMDSVLSIAGTSLIISPIIGLFTSLLPAPIAAFLAYNFGARKRAAEEMAKQQVPLEDE